MARKNKRQKAIKLIRKVILGSKKTHLLWLDFFKKHPDLEAQYRYAGDINHHNKYVERYNKVLQALAFIEDLNA